MSNSNQKRKRSFQFKNCAVDNPEYMEIITESWNQEEHGRLMYIVWRKLKRLEPNLTKLNNKVTYGIRKLRKSRAKLEQAQKSLAGDSYGL